MAAMNGLKESDINSEVKVCQVSDLQLQKTGRKVVKVHDREIVIFRTKDHYYALDKFCYHAGGPLEAGDIEDIAGNTCVICPWHRYIICLPNGEGMYQAIDPKHLKKPPEWKSKGLRQRTHTVVQKGGYLYVTISDLTKEVPSDHYYSEEMRKLTWKVPDLKK